MNNKQTIRQYKMINQAFSSFYTDDEDDAENPPRNKNWLLFYQQFNENNDTTDPWNLINDVVFLIDDDDWYF